MLVSISLAVAYATFAGKAFHSRDAAFAAPVTGLSLPGVSSSIPPSDHSVLRPPVINKTLRAEQPVPKSQQDAAQLLAEANAPTPTPPPAESVPAAAAQEDAVVRGATPAQPPDLPPYQVYVVEDGDTVIGIAAKFGLEPEYITANNAEVQAGQLVVGQSIIVPAGNGVLHEIRYGETLSDIAARYDVPLDDITSFVPNHITSPNDILETQLVFVPNAKPLPAEAAEPEPGATEPTDDSLVEAPPPEDDSSSGEDTSGASSSGGGPSSALGVAWPLYGPVSSNYGPSHPLGIDIDGFNLGGAYVGAATSGTVVFAGGNACCSYGLYVVIMSSGGIETLYAHLSSISVSQGETVSQGQAIGVIGSSGYSTGRHLHFEVIDNGVRVNPMSYLP